MTRFYDDNSIHFLSNNLRTPFSEKLHDQQRTAYFCFQTKGNDIFSFLSISFSIYLPHSLSHSQPFLSSISIAPSSLNDLLNFREGQSFDFLGLFLQHVSGGTFSLLDDALHRCSHTIPRPFLTVIYVFLDFLHFIFAILFFFLVEVSFLFPFCDFFISFLGLVSIVLF